MSNYCENCKHAHKWSDREKLDYLNRTFDLLGSLPRYEVDHYYCDKIPKGKEWTDEETGNIYSYDGYSLEGECYDDVFHCFERGGRE